MPAAALERFHPCTQAWFAASFDRPTAAQEGAWENIAAGSHTLVVAPTGSGKTLAAFLASIDRLVRRDPALAGSGVRTLYISPLKALAVDVERNLREPLRGIHAEAERAGVRLAPVEVGSRSGDTPAAERRRFVKHPCDVLITTPESLYLLLTSAARELLRTVDTVIVDEIHALAGSKRGSHLALSLERLDCLLPRPAQRLGLSATVRPLDEVARFLGGRNPVAIVDARADKVVEVEVVVPVDDMTALARLQDETPGDRAGGSLWPHVEQRVLELIRLHRSTIVFANSRRLAERLCARINELASEEIARAHHGSISHERRAVIEEQLKSGELRAVVATSSLELGIDMGAVDLVVQIEAPPSVAAGLQRIGRAGHQVGAASRGTIFPKFRGDLLESAVLAERMTCGAIEALRFPRNPLDVLAQHIVAMVALDDWTVDSVEEVVRRAAPFAELPRSALEGVLDMLAGRYPSDAFAGLRARIHWDRSSGRIESRPGSRLQAVTSGGTIPDRGLFAVYLVGEKQTRVGELDEEMVYESRVGDVFLLGASSWRIEEIGADRVLVSPAPGEPGRMPFWHGDAPGRPLELGAAIGAFLREVGDLHGDARLHRLAQTGCDGRAAANLARYLDDQRAATGALPDDRTIVVERFRDAVGDWRLCLHSFFGARVHGPWAQALNARLRQRFDVGMQVIYSDDGIVVRVPDGDEMPGVEDLIPDPDEVEELVITEVGGSSLFASRFRECAARSLLLPRRRPGARTPLWLQRQKAATLLQVAAKFPSFPIVLETHRECLRDVFDLPALVGLLRQVRSREIRVVETQTELPSPFASSLQRAYVGAFLYEGDAPLAERRAQALALDRTVLAGIMGREELRDLLDPRAIAEVEANLQHLDAERRARDAEDLLDLLRSLGDLTTDEVQARAAGDPHPWLESLAAAGRVLVVTVAGELRWIALEDATRYRDGLGCVLPAGLPDAFLEEVDDPLGDLVSRHARTHGPFTLAEVCRRFDVAAGILRLALDALERSGRIVEGEYRPGGSGTEWIDVEVLRRVRRRSLAALRREIEPVAPAALARFALDWHAVGAGRARPGGVEALWRVLEQIQGVPLPASVLEAQILRPRLPDYSPAQLDEIGLSGELLWCGAGALGGNDGWVVLATGTNAASLFPDPVPGRPSPLAAQVLARLGERGALFFRQIADIDGAGEADVLAALWELVWRGLVTNDTIAPLRALVLRRPLGAGAGRSRTRRRPLTRGAPPAAAGRWSLTPVRSAETTRRRYDGAEQLLARHGVVTRGAVVADRVPGGFGAVYPVLRAFEESGRCRRGYFVEGLGGAQFALPGAVDRMRALGRDDGGSGEEAVVLAATDPANPYGAALPWPDRGATDPSRRAARKAGALVVLHAGEVVLYVEKGGRSVLTFTEDERALGRAAAAIAAGMRGGMIRRFEPERVDGQRLLGSSLEKVLLAGGFKPTYRGLELRE